MAYLLQRLLTDAAARQPQRAAVASSGCLLTYQELDELSNKMARALLRLGIAPGDRVGILAPKSAASVVALYGVLKAGACYVPLDPKAPAQRLSYVIQDSGTAVIVADEARAPQAAVLLGSVPRPLGVVVAAPGGSEGAGEPGAAPADTGLADTGLADGAAIVPWTAVAAEPGEALRQERSIETDLAYILYTSGSTGIPKGVMISHRNSLTFAEWAAAAAGLSEQDRVCSPAPLHFDLSVFDVFSSCRAGACLAVLPEGSATFPVSMAQWLERERITVWYSVPSVLTLLACYGGLREFDLSQLRTVIFAGEVFPPKHLARLMEELPHPRYLNWYGPTETNVCTAFEVPADWADARPVPIGKACANSEVFAVTSDGSRVSEAGEIGELYVRGPSLMRGYWGQPAKTGEVLVQNPFRPEYDESVYRTGDLVSLDPAGNYTYVGRRDSMVKIRGYRVELGEVEAALYRHPAIREAAVLPVPDELLGSRLRAVVITDDSGKLVRQSVLDHCRQWLPSYMVPDVVEFREAMPRTSTGKVDRAGLASEQHARLRQLQQSATDKHRRKVPTWRPLSMLTLAPSSSATRNFSRSRTRHHCWRAASSIRSASCSWWSSWRSASESLWATRICYRRTLPAWTLSAPICVPGSPRSRPRMGEGRADRLIRNAEGVAYWAAAAPILARLPPGLGYRIARRRGDWIFRRHAAERAEIARNLRQILGGELSPAAVDDVTREWFRLSSCEAVDVSRLRRTGQPLRRLVDFRGLEHLESALAGGRGAIVCSAHFGSFDCAFSMLGACGFPVTTIGRWQHNYTTRLSRAERQFWDAVYARPLRRHRKRPNIEPWTGRFDVAARAANVLRANEVLTIAIDAPPLDSDETRTAEVPFLGRRARLLPGVATLARVTGAPVLTAFLHRSADYCHQVLEISAPLPAGGDTAATFARCAAEVSAAITRRPAHWRYWASSTDLARLGLILPEQDRSPAAAQVAYGQLTLPAS